MALVLKMQIDDRQEHQYIFSTGDDGTIELIPLNVVVNGSYPAPEGKAFNLVTVSVPEITLEQLNVQHSGTYTAPSGTAYDVVTVDIPEYILDSLTATENGTFTPESGHVYNRVVVNVPTPTPTTETKQVTYTSNGTYTVDKSSNVDGMTSVTVIVNVPTPQANYQTKQFEVYQNGLYNVTPDTGYDALDEVDVIVDVGSTPVVETLELTGANKITQNGNYTFLPVTYMADYFDGVDLTVDVSGSGGATNLKHISYSPSQNGNGIDTINTGYTGNGYVIGVFVFASTRLLTQGALNNACFAKRLAHATPNYTGSTTTDNDLANGSRARGASSSISVSAFAGAVYGSSLQPGGLVGSSPVTVNSQTQISLYHIGTGTGSSTNMGFMYGESYDVYVLYSE